MRKVCKSKKFYLNFSLKDALEVESIAYEVELMSKSTIIIYRPNAYRSFTPHAQ